jgi:type I restriction enzyme S subunit
LFWFLRAIRQKLLKSSFGGAQPNISQEIIRNLEVPIPYPDDPARSLAEQRRIAARLETLLGETREMRAEVQSMRRDLAQVMESALAEAFPAPQGEVVEGWGWKRLGDICTYTNGVWGDSDPKGIPVLRSTDFLPDGTLNYYSAARLTLDEKAIKKASLIPGDILLERSGGGPKKPVGRVAYFSDTGIYCFGNFITRLRTSTDTVYPRYLFMFLYQFHVLGYTEKLQTQTTNIRNLRFQEYLDVEVPIPYPNDPARSLDEQRRIVASLERIAEETRALDASLAQDLRDLEALEQSILAAAFRGEV